jgi:hypothetical protein
MTGSVPQLAQIDTARSLVQKSEATFKTWRRAVGWSCAILVLLVLDILFVKGYYFGEGDHTFYIPQLQAELDPSLYPNATAIARITNQFSFFNPLFAAPARWLGIQWTFLIAYLIASVGFYFICFLLAKKLTGDRLIAYGFLLLNLPATVLGETATVVWDPFLTHRDLVLPVCLFGVYLILNCKYALAYFLFGLAALIHPITAAAFAAASSGPVAYDLSRKFVKPRVVLLAGGAMIAGAGLLLLKVFTSPTADAGFFSPTTADWVAIVRYRASYILPEFSLRWVWSWGAWLLVFVVAWLAKPIRSREDAVIVAIVMTCGVLLVLSLVVGSVIPVIPLARFEFGRSLLIIVLFARIYLAAVLWRGFTSIFFLERASAAVGAVAALSLHGQYLSPSRVGMVICAVLVLEGFRRNILPQANRRVVAGGFVVLAAISLRSELLGVLAATKKLLFTPYGIGLALVLFVGAAMLAVLKHLRFQGVIATCGFLFCVIYASAFSREGWGLKTLDLPGLLPITPWVQAQLWAKEHTAKDAVFMAPWRRPSGFPIFSQRSTVADWESGGDVKFNYRFARRWGSERDDLEKFDQFATADFCRLRTKYEFEYLVTKRAQILRFPLLYENREFSIYQFSEPTCRETQSNVA